MLLRKSLTYLLMLIALSGSSLFSSILTEGSVRHTEGKGIGYKKGYTTFEGFFTLDDCNCFLPFVDLRAHVFNNGKFASNAGLGIRSLWNCRAYGLNVFYDYRHTKHHNYNQVGVGFESLGRCWDFRVNGYIPVGRKRSHEFGYARFESFVGNQMLINHRYEQAMGGFDAEVACNVYPCRYFDILTAGIGPYYFKGEHHRGAFGGKGRVTGRFARYFSLEVSGSYDSVFRGIVQGQIGFNVAFGGNGFSECCECPQERFLRDPLLKPVVRQEIIVLKNHRRDSVALDPTTDLPLNFIFVNNLNGSLGTFEDPFATLLEAQNGSRPNDIIYVYPGDGTDKGMNTGMILQNQQKLLGTGLSYDFATSDGVVNVPALSTGRPLLTNLVNIPSPVIQSASGNEIAGLHIRAIGAQVPNRGIGILCSGIQDTNIHNNLIETVNPIYNANPVGIRFIGSGGNLLVNENTLSTLTNGPSWHMQIVSTNADASYNITNNAFVSSVPSASTGMEIADTAGIGIPLGNFTLLNFTNNRFIGLGKNSGIVLGGKAIGGFGFGGSGRIVIDQNTFFECNAHAPAIVFLRLRSGSNINASITNNSWIASQDPTKQSLQVVSLSGSAASCITLQGNKSDNTTIAYDLDNSAGTSTMTVDVSNNIGVFEGFNTTAGTCPIP